MAPGDTPDSDNLPERSRFLFVVARTRADLLPTLRRQFQDDRRVEVMLDRRAHERRSQSGVADGLTERRRLGDRRRPRDYWEDTTHHPAVLIPVATGSATIDLDTAPAAPSREPAPEPPMERLLVDDTRLRVWVEESQRALQLLPALLDQRAGLVAQLHEATRRAEELQRDNDALRAEIARTAAAHHQLAVGHADVVDSVSLFLAQLIEVLEPVRVLAEKQNRERSSSTS